MSPTRHRARPSVVPALLAGVLLAAAGCASPASGGPGAGSTSAGGATVRAAASINAWGSILGQLGGTRVTTTSIITSPDTDPHDYEPTPADGRTVAGARVFVENGIGYDAWAAKALDANPDDTRAVIDVGQVTGVAEGGNPHRWYSPPDVEKVADAITAALTKADPQGAATFAAQRRSFDATGLAEYHKLIADIRARYAGTGIGASESIVAPLADALGLKLLTPATFLTAISEGTDPTAADTSAIDRQIADKLIKVYVFNSQNSTPDVAAQVAAAKRRGIPVVAVTETLSPAGATFQEWQSAQLRALQAALALATGR